MIPESGNEWIRVLASNVVTLGVAWIAFGQARVEVEPAYVEILQKEIRILRSDYGKLQADNIGLTLKIKDMEYQLGGNIIELESDAVWSLLDRVDRPAWCKEVVLDDEQQPTFVMRYLNKAYELRYKLTSAYYIGKTDFESQRDINVSQAYYRNDKKAYSSRSYVEYTEPTVNQGDRVFAKWWVQLPSGIEFVCGFEVGELI